MAHRSLRALRPRLHHRTRPTPVDAATFHPPRDAIDAAALGLIDRMQPIMYHGRPSLCQTCGRSIFPGHTAYWLHFPDAHPRLACYECGEAIACHMGIIDPASAPWNLPFGGPATPARERPADDRQ